MEVLLMLSILPSIIIAFLIYKSDKKEKEPIGELAKAFFIGVLAVFLTVILSIIFKVTEIDIEMLLEEDLFKIFTYSFISIALIEELSKWICGYLFLRKNRNYDYMFDGIVYFVFIALGFATVENILYATTSDLSTIIIRAITTVPAHAFFGVFSGYYLSLHKKEKLNKKIPIDRYLFLSIISPILLHGFFDFCLLTQNLLFFMTYIVFVVTLYFISINKIKEMMKKDELIENKVEE